MFSLKNASPFIYSNVGLLGAFVCSPFLAASALSIESLSLAILGQSVFSQHNPLPKAEPAPALAARTAPAPLPILSISVKPVVLSCASDAAAVGIDAGVGSNSLDSDSSARTSALVDCKSSSDVEKLCDLFAKSSLCSSSGPSASSATSKSGSAVLPLGNSRIPSPMAVLPTISATVSATVLATTVAKPQVATPKVAKAKTSDNPPERSLTTEALVDVAIESNQAASARRTSPRPRSLANRTTVTSPSRSSAPALSTPPRSSTSASTTTPAAGTATPHLEPSSPSPTSITPTRNQKSRMTSASRLSVLAIKSVLPSSDEPSTFRSRETPPPAASPKARPVASSSSQLSPAKFNPPLIASDTSPTSVKVACAPTPELTPPPTPRRRKPASRFDGQPQPSASLSPPSSSSSTPPVLTPLPIHHEEVKPASASPAASTTSTQPPFPFIPFADLTVSLPAPPSTPGESLAGLPAPTSPDSLIESSDLSPTPPHGASSLLPSLPISSPATPLASGPDGLAGSRWAPAGHRDDAPLVRVVNEEHEAAEMAYRTDAQINHHDTLLNSPNGEEVKPPTVPPHGRASDNFIEDNSSSSNSKALAAMIVDGSSADDSEEEVRTPGVISPLRLQRHAAPVDVPGLFQSNSVTDLVAIVPQAVPQDVPEASPAAASVASTSPGCSAAMELLDTSDDEVKKEAYSQKVKKMMEALRKAKWYAELESEEPEDEDYYW